MGGDEWRDAARRLDARVEALERELDLLKAVLSGAPGVMEFLSRRGFSVSREENLPAPLLPEGEEKTARYYGLLRKYSFRIFMRDLIARPAGFSARQKWKYISPRTVGLYLAELLSLGLIRAETGGKYRLVRGDVPGFGETLEWFVAEVLRREFHLPAERGLKIRGMPAGGDFDILALVAGRLVYLEVKSSPPKHIEPREVASFARRTRELGPAAAIFLADTQLRLRDKIIPMLREALGKGGPAPRRLAEGIYLFPGPVFAAGSKPSLIHNLRFCLAELYREEIIV